MGGLVRAELIGMHSECRRKVHLRCEPDIACVGELVRAKLTGMYFKSFRTHLRCEPVIACVGEMVRTELTGTFFNPLELFYAVNLALLL